MVELGGPRKAEKGTLWWRHHTQLTAIRPFRA